MTVYRAFRNSVQSRTLRIKTGNYPCFLYPNNAAYNSKDRAKGLFRGHVFIRVHFHCWSVMFPDTSSSKDSLVCLHGPFVCLHWSPNCCTCLKLRDPRNEGSNSRDDRIYICPSKYSPITYHLNVLLALMPITLRPISRFPTSGTGATLATAHSTIQSSSRISSSCFIIETPHGFETLWNT